MLVGIQADQRRKLEQERERLLQELRATALSDPLTGLPNRRAWDERFEHELALASRSGRPLSVAAIRPRQVEAGQRPTRTRAGNRLIERCARLWANALRETDFIARIGGDEFFVLLPDCPEAQAEQTARRMLAAVPPGHSFSIGIATWHGDEKGYELVHRAHRAMYAAKAGGGNCITVARGTRK